MDYIRRTNIIQNGKAYIEENKETFIVFGIGVVGISLCYLGKKLTVNMSNYFRRDIIMKKR